ncbi:bifunctional adenosylcobinamide kinase/adenosylcobinamide-phosphate guanylyltransferase [Sulfurimonas sp.]
MKTLFIGGIKSGKSKAAETYIKKISDTKPIYLATTEFIDDEMALRIAKHKEMRSDSFITQEEALDLKEIISLQKAPVLVECLSVWINNMLYHEHSYEEMQMQLAEIMQLKQNIVFVINDVSCGIIPQNKLAREFVDLNGKIAQFVAQECDEVYNVIAGISVQIK